MSFTTCEKAFRDKSFHLRIWFSHCSHCLLHWSTQGSSMDFSKSSSLFNLLCSITSLAFSIFHKVAMTSCTTLLPLLNMNYARSVLPSAVCTFVSATSSVLLRIPLSMIIFETSKLLKCPECFRLTALLAYLPSSLLLSWPLLSSLLAGLEDSSLWPLVMAGTLRFFASLTCWCSSLWTRVGQVTMIRRLNVVSVFFGCVQPSSVIINVPVRKVNVKAPFVL